MSDIYRLGQSLHRSSFAQSSKVNGSGSTVSPTTKRALYSAKLHRRRCSSDALVVTLSSHAMKALHSQKSLRKKLPLTQQEIMIYYSMRLPDKYMYEDTEQVLFIDCAHEFHLKGYCIQIILIYTLFYIIPPSGITICNLVNYIGVSRQMAKQHSVNHFYIVPI